MQQHPVLFWHGREAWDTFPLQPLSPAQLGQALVFAFFHVPTVCICCPRINFVVVTTLGVCWTETFFNWSVWKRIIWRIRTRSQVRACITSIRSHHAHRTFTYSPTSNTSLSYPKPLPFLSGASTVLIKDLCFAMKYEVAFGCTCGLSL